VKILKTAALGALLAMALTVSVNAKEDDKPEKDKKDKDKVEVVVVDATPGTNSGKPYSVPDTGSTVALLAFSVALLALSQRKISRAE
jgi:hypothetical protein